jgi:hypothetical protein
VIVPDMTEMLYAHEIRTLSNGRLEEPTEEPMNVIDFPGRERLA